MAKVRPFICVRPCTEQASEVAALPYDVYSRKEAKEVVQGHPLSFLNIDRPETQYDESFDMYSDKAYETARDMLRKEIRDGVFVVDQDASYYIYELTMDGRSQSGIVACCSIDDYLNNVIKKHENTRAEKEQDRIRHVDVCSAQTGPIFLAYRANAILKAILDKVKENDCLYDFVSDDGIGHRVWKIDSPADIDVIESTFDGISEIYISDGHHRCASAVKVGLKRREEPGYRPGQESDYFLAVLFADEELKILPYNRAVHDLNGLSADEYLQKVSGAFLIEDLGKEDYQPVKHGEIGMNLGGEWYRLTAKPEVLSAVEKDPVARLDVSILQDQLLDPILGIKDPKTSDRIDFVGGIRGTAELDKLVGQGYGVAFSMYPTQMSELLAVADAGLLMPPKSTWFEPKLRSGLFIHQI